MTRLPPADDHRTRVAAQRRERTRQSLLESAMLVFAERGPDASVIDEVIRTAGVSRGTFYNYFRSDDALLAAVAEEVGNQILVIVDPAVRDLPDPGARVACGVRLVLAIARAHPHLAAFMARVGPPAVGAQSRATASLTRDLADGTRSGRFANLDARLAFDLVVGPVLAGFHTMVTRRVPAGYVDAMAQSVLQALGVPKATARRLASLPLDVPSPAADSLLVRAEARAAQVRRIS